MDDSARLEWVIRHPNYRVMGSDERGWAVMDCSNGLSFIVRGLATFREAIDAAIAAKESNPE